MPEALRALQQRFLAGITTDDAGAEALIVDDRRVGATKRLGIYRNNYRASLTGVLADHFERLHAYLGDEQFDTVALAYLAAHPSTTRNLRYYGDAFPDFLARHFPNDAELAEIAALDWALRHAFDAADAVPLDAERVGALGDSWIEAPLSLHPSARLLPMHHNSAAIWSALSAEEPPPEVALLDCPVTVLAWRNGLQPQFRSLTTEEAEAFTAISAGASFADISARMIGILGEAAAMETLAAWLRQWLADGVLVTADQPLAVT
jgi:hypothetical protein